MRQALVIAAMLLPLSSPVLERQASDDVVFRNVNVVDVEHGTTRPAQSVIVRGQRITWIGNNTELRTLTGARIVQCEGCYLAPGLADMHVHITRDDFPLLVANGVTTVREMNGSAEHLRWRTDIEKHDSLGPMLFIGSPLIAGRAQRFRHVLVANANEATAAVKDAVTAGFDFIKAYNDLTMDAYRALVAEARRAGKPVVGHIPRSVGLDTVLASGQRSIEHIDQLLASITGHPPSLDSIAPAVAKIRRFPSVWIEPTLAVEKFLSMPVSPWADSLFAGPAFAFVDAGTMGWWGSLRGRAPDEATRARQQAYFDWKRQFVSALHASGQRFLVGTDTPNPGMVPGFSLVEELLVLTETGMSRAEVLRAATVGAAEFMEMPGEFGVIRVGARADLVLLRENPLADLRALHGPEGVMVRGRWLDRASLDQMLTTRGKLNGR